MCVCERERGREEAGDARWSCESWAGGKKCLFGSEGTRVVQKCVGGGKEECENAEEREEDGSKTDNSSEAEGMQREEGKRK